MRSLPSDLASSIPAGWEHYYTDPNVKRDDVVWGYDKAYFYFLFEFGLLICLARLHSWWATRSEQRPPSSRAADAFVHAFMGCRAETTSKAPRCG
jgi:hypothetical protein